MLGSFLEIGIGTRDLASTYDAFRSLGFAPVPAGDARGDRYAVVSDGATYVGLCEREHAEISLTFVRPDLEQYIHALRRRAIELEFARLGEQEFHEVAFRDPDGQLVTLVEARTFSPTSAHDLPLSLCGRFLELSIATRALERAQAFWEDLGLIATDGGDIPHPWRRLAVPGLALGLHETSRFDPGLCFSASQLEARADYLRAKGFAVDLRGPEFSEAKPSARISIADATVLYLVADPADAD